MGQNVTELETCVFYRYYSGVLFWCQSWAVYGDLLILQMGHRTNGS